MSKVVLVGRTHTLARRALAWALAAGLQPKPKHAARGVTERRRHLETQLTGFVTRGGSSCPCCSVIIVSESSSPSYRSRRPVTAPE